MFVLAKLLTHPHQSMQLLWRGYQVKDRLFAKQTGWFSHGSLQRVSLLEIFPNSKEVEIVLPRALDRRFGVSISVEEATILCVIERCVMARKVLEIGTFDGNTTLALAANLQKGGEVVTVDLPPDFDLRNQRALLKYPDAQINLTPRTELGRQHQNHPSSHLIRQIYGDSAVIDWGGLGGPFDLIFIDGCHTEEYVQSDTQNALNQLTEKGVIVWHDYSMIPEVCKVVDRLATSRHEDLRVFAIEGARLAIGLKTSRAIVDKD